MAVSEERVVLTAELQDELSAPLQRVERNLINATSNMLNASRRQASATSRNMADVGRSMTRSAGDATRWGRAFGQVTTGGSRAFSVMVTTIDGDQNRLQRGWSAVSSAASRMGSAVGTGFMAGARGAVDGVKSMSNTMDTLTTKMGKVGSNIGKELGNGFKTAAAVAGTAFATISGMAISGGLSRMLNIEDAQAKLLGLGNSTEAVSQMMEDANTAVTGTAFGLDQAATVAAMAASSGIKPGKEMAEYLTLVADASTIAGTELSEMGDIMGDIVTAGAVTGGALNRFQIRGVGVTQMLAKSFGKTTQEIDAMVSAGEISVEQFQKVLTESLGGAAQKSGETTRGALKNMRAALSRTGEAMLTGFMPMAKATFTAVTKGLNALNKMVKPVMVSFGAQFTEKALPAIEAWGDQTVVWLGKVGAGFSALSDLLFKGDFTGEFRELFNVEEDSEIVDFILDIRDAFIALEPVAAPIIGGLSMAFGGLLSKLPLIGRFIPTIHPLLGVFLGLLMMSPELRDALMSVFEALAPVITQVMDALAPLLPVLVDITVELVEFAAVLIDKLAPFLPGLAITFGVLWGAVKLLNFWNKAAALSTLVLAAAQAGMNRGLGLSHGLTTKQTKAVRGSTTAMTALKGSLLGTKVAMGAARVGSLLLKGAVLALGFLSTPIGLIVAAVGLLIAGFVLAYKKVGWFKDGVDAAVAWIVDAFHNSVDWIVGAWQTVVDWWNANLMPAIRAVGDWFADCWAWIVEKAQGFASMVNDAVGKVVEWWEGTLLPALRKVRDWFADAWAWIVEKARGFAGMLSDALGKVVEFWEGTLLPGLRKVRDFFVAIFDYIKTLVLNFVAVVVAIFLRLKSFWETHLLPALQWVGDKFGEILNWINENVIQPVIDTAISLFNGLVDFWNNTLIPAVEWLGEKIGEILNWINENIIQPVVNAAIAVFTTLVDFWNNTLIPAVQWLGDKFFEILTWINETIIQPIVALIVGAFNGLIWLWNGVLIPAVQAVGNFFATIWNWVLTTIIQPVIAGITAAFNGIIAFWNDTLLPIVQAVGDWFKDKIGAGIDLVKTAIDGMKEGFQGFIDFWKNTLAPIVESVQTAFGKVGDVVGGAVGGLKDFASNPFGGLQDALGVEKDENGNGIVGTGGAGGMVVPGYAGGGIIPGYAPGVDNFPAVLSPGESVLVPELTRAIGAANIMALNSKYSGGRKAGAGPSPALLPAAPKAAAPVNISVALAAPQQTGFAAPTIPSPRINLSMAPVIPELPTDRGAAADPAAFIPPPPREVVPADVSSFSASARETMVAEQTTRKVNITIQEGAVKLTFTGDQPNEPEDIADAVREALEELLDELERKSY